jgi:hypothetical protein
VGCDAGTWPTPKLPPATALALSVLLGNWRHLPPAEALRANPYHPLYPIAIMAASKVIVPLCDENLPRAMQYSAAGGQRGC